MSGWPGRFVKPRRGLSDEKVLSAATGGPHNCTTE